MPRRSGLPAPHRRALALLIPEILGVPPAPLVDGAVVRIDDFVRALPDPSSRRDLRLLFTALDLLAVAWFMRPIHKMDEPTPRLFVQRLFAPADLADRSLLDALSGWTGGRIPTTPDLARALRELVTLSYWSQPGTDADSGYVPPWRRPRVLDVDPEVERRHPFTTPDRSRIDVSAIRDAQRPVVAPGRRWFHGNGRPKVVILGAGMAGCVVASVLADRHDVALFEAGPRLEPREFAFDPMATMALCYDRALMAPTLDLDVRIMAARVVGGGGVLNEGVYVRPPRGVLLRWIQDGAPLDLPALDRALDEVAARQRLTVYADDLLTDPTRLFERALQGRRGLEHARLLSDVATHEHQHGEERPGWTGPRCLGCGLCNHGCHWGHHRSVDRTWLWDAERAGAQVWANQPVRRILSRRVGQESRATGIELMSGETVPADVVVLAAGAVGSPALLLRSLTGTALASIPSARSRAVGRRFGFNYGSSVLARFPAAFSRPGWDGVQVGMIAAQSGVDSWILENGFIGPGLLASCTPGIGGLHRSWMQSYGRLAMAVNTVGSAPTGAVDAAGRVAYRLSGQELDTVRRSLAEIVDIYLHAGAEAVALGGTGGLSSSAIFGPAQRGHDRAILERIERDFPTADWLGLASGHPQGGLGLGRTPSDGVTAADFRVHGTSNLHVADASLFPAPLTVNPQWLVQALALLAGRAVASRLAEPRAT